MNYLRGIGFGKDSFLGLGGDPGSVGDSKPFVMTSDDGRGWSEAIPVTTTPRVAFGDAVRLSRGLRSEPNPATNRRNADSMPDGEHVVGVLFGGSQGGLGSEITVVLNWFDEVRQRAPRK